MATIIGTLQAVLGMDVRPFVAGSRQARGEMGKLGTSTTQLSGTIGVLAKSFGALAVARVASGMIETGLRFDRLRLGLTAVAGSAEEAGRQLERLQDIAKLPGLGFEEAIRGSSRLQAAGFAATEAEEAIRAFGNALATVGGSKAELDRVLLALVQIRSAGKVLGQEVRQLQQVLPQIRQAMIAAFGTARSEEIQALGIDSETFIRKLVAEFKKLPPVQSGLANSAENLDDAYKRLSDTFTRVMEPNLKATNDALSRAADVLSAVLEPATNFEGVLPLIARKLTEWANQAADVTRRTSEMREEVKRATGDFTGLGLSIEEAGRKASEAFLAMKNIPELFTGRSSAEIASSAAAEFHRGPVTPPADPLPTEEIKRAIDLARLAAREQQALVDAYGKTADELKLMGLEYDRIRDKLSLSADLTARERGELERLIDVQFDAKRAIVEMAIAEEEANKALEAQGVALRDLVRSWNEMRAAARSGGVLVSPDAVRPTPGTAAQMDERRLEAIATLMANGFEDAANRLLTPFEKDMKDAADAQLQAAQAIGSAVVGVMSQGFGGQFGGIAQGAMAGLVTGDPVAVAAGVLGGIGAELFSFSNDAREAERAMQEARAAWKQALEDFTRLFDDTSAFDEARRNLQEQAIDLIRGALQDAGISGAQTVNFGNLDDVLAGLAARGDLFAGVIADIDVVLAAFGINLEQLEQQFREAAEATKADLQVRLLYAQGLDEAARALENQLGMEREIARLKQELGEFYTDEIDSLIRLIFETEELNRQRDAEAEAAREAADAARELAEATAEAAEAMKQQAHAAQGVLAGLLGEGADLGTVDPQQAFAFQLAFQREEFLKTLEGLGLTPEQFAYYLDLFDTNQQAKIDKWLAEHGGVIDAATEAVAEAVGVAGRVADEVVRHVSSITSTQATNLTDIARSQLVIQQEIAANTRPLRMGEFDGFGGGTGPRNTYQIYFTGQVLAADEGSAYRIGRAFGRGLDEALGNQAAQDDFITGIPT